MSNINDTDRMKELIEVLNKASKAYYAEDIEIMSNAEYDALYDELLMLEEKTGTVLAGSPTVNVGYEAVDNLPKETHESPMLSLDKTKDREALRDWLNGHEALLSWKLDGLTIVLTYENGTLSKAVTRGNGEVGEVVTNNAKTFINLPHKIAYKGKLIIRGEAVISYDDFNKINEEIPEEGAKYKNPRNLCSGSVRQLNNEITAKRNVRFIAFNYVSQGGSDTDFKLRSEQFDFLKKQGFEVVEYHKVTEDSILDKISYFAKMVANYPIPSDGLVLTYNDIEYGRSLGRTAKFPRDSIAFKWADETANTHLIDMEWSPSRTGLINPVAIFEPVELEGTTVSRASVHNVSIVKSLMLGIGDEISVYKANMIIPQIKENFTKSGNLTIPKFCPACSEKTQIKNENGVETLYCVNEACPAKQIKRFSLFVSRDAMKIDGLSEATLEKFISVGFIKKLSDIYKLAEHKEAICNMDGFGDKSYEKLISSIEKSRDVLLPNLIYALGILNVGLSNAKIICKAFDYDIEKIKNATVEEIAVTDNIGDVIATSVFDFFHDSEKLSEFNELVNELNILIPEKKETNSNIGGKTFVITGSLNTYENRNALKDLIESLGGKVAGSVSAKTDYLINNDVTSNSSKNKKAKELNVQIISEEDFNELIK
ncbi:MAG: NAD-dependent DNA ligase LigA [Lachnospiraceae bacterium]|nr:NAD-dependent DNA ligase LigA [Lachnospiraceae bacterium]MCI6977462.1 NAD-dependent DNA ligase LigA [Lachnospiraceae bacterium]MDD7224219.1 NAD-dependent DNA ligase LigA [Lachnospiraceae bacterium]MDY4428470.1 NAD-dependent DNA ligase LigA [Lachnospiraceae bacterium]MDY4837674.1 NAD-dependent DNA ligase LigA [Lachnospiraceae bacterium]